jgi:hypothetical protein
LVKNKPFESKLKPKSGYNIDLTLNKNFDPRPSRLSEE